MQTVYLISSYYKSNFISGEEMAVAFCCTQMYTLTFIGIVYYTDNCDCTIHN